VRADNAQTSANNAQTSANNAQATANGKTAPSHVHSYGYYSYTGTDSNGYMYGPYWVSTYTGAAS
jgi:hypothetical protein